MRLLIEALLLFVGALFIALGVSQLSANTAGPAQAAALSALGTAMALAGAVMTLRLKPVKAPPLQSPPPSMRSGAFHGPLTEPLAVVHLSWSGHGAPVVLGASPQAAVMTEPGGVLRISLRHGRATRAMVCRAGAAQPAYFNTLKRARNEAAIKLIAPVAGPIRLEFWDATALPAR